MLRQINCPDRADDWASISTIMIIIIITIFILTFSVQLDSMLTMLRQTDCTDRAGDQSSVRMERHIWPLLYTWGWIGMLGPRNVT